jgi:hypothetical protein
MVKGAPFAFVSSVGRNYRNDQLTGTSGRNDIFHPSCFGKSLSSVPDTIEIEDKSLRRRACSSMSIWLLCSRTRITVVPPERSL